VLLASVHETPWAVAALRQVVDYCVTIDNDVGGEPRLVGLCEESGQEGGETEARETWREFREVWRGDDGVGSQFSEGGEEGGWPEEG
jgi:hypothetical protein